MIRKCASVAMPCAEEDAEHTAFLAATWSLLGTGTGCPGILTSGQLPKLGIQ